MIMNWNRYVNGFLRQTCIYLEGEVIAKMEQVQTVNADAARSDELNQIDEMQFDEKLLLIGGLKAAHH